MSIWRIGCYHEILESLDIILVIAFAFSSDSSGVLQIKRTTKYFSMYLPQMQIQVMIPLLRSICKPSNNSSLPSVRIS